MTEAGTSPITRRGALHALTAIGLIATTPTIAAPADSPIAHLGTLFEAEAKKAQAAMAALDEAGIADALRQLNRISTAMEFFEARGTAETAILRRRDEFHLTHPTFGHTVWLGYGRAA